MPPEKSPTEKKKGKIVNMLCNGKSTDGIATALERSLKVVWTFTEASEKYGEAERSKRPSKLSAADGRILFQSSS